MVNVARASKIIAELGMLKFFPAGEFAQVGVVKLVCSMADNDGQVRWLVDRMLTLYNEWPGPQEMRACFCSKYRPVDGIEASSTVYHGSDGIPSETESSPRQIEAQPVRRLTAGEITQDAQMRHALTSVAASKRMR